MLLLQIIRCVFIRKIWNIAINTHYVVVRKDLPLGFQAAQIVHAAGESVTVEVPPGTNAVVLETKNESELLAVMARLQRAGVPHVPIREVDAPYANQLTAVGITPLKDRSLVKKILGKLKLLSGREETPALK